MKICYQLDFFLESLRHTAKVIMRTTTPQKKDFFIPTLRSGQASKEVTKLHNNISTGRRHEKSKLLVCKCDGI